MTLHFDLTLQMPAFSAQENVRIVFSSILDDTDTRLAIHDLKQSSFSYHVPGERGLRVISANFPDFCTPHPVLLKQLSILDI